MRPLQHHPLLAHNTFGIDVQCHTFIEYASECEAVEIALALPTTLPHPYLLLGGGSNLLFTEDYPGTVVHSTIKDVAVTHLSDGVLLRAGAGCTWDEIAAMAVQQGWHGTENLALIPGEVGASAVQNIGAYGAEIKDIIHSVEAVEIGSGKICRFYNAECGYGYRTSRFKTEWRNKYLITYVTYKLSTTFTPHLEYGNIRQALAQKGISQPTAQQLREIIIEIRKEKLPDPKEIGNAGSFFMNPIVSATIFRSLQSQYPDMPHYTIDAQHVKIPAGWLIEQCGWKGKSMGKAGVHHKQALVLVNLGGARGKDIVLLMQQITKDVYNKFGISILPEVNVVGSID